MRAAAPALVRQAEAVIPTARRWGTTTPWASNAAAERTTAPRLRGSVTPSMATISGGRPEWRGRARGAPGGGGADGGGRRPPPPGGGAPRPPAEPALPGPRPAPP